jgi:hypothetical protein
MPPIDATTLPALPAPFWFVEFFKVLGFVLHMAPMNLWYAGLVLAVVLGVFGCEHGRRWGSRLMLQMPILVAAGINLGIVPLLFLQVAYAKAFYPATILMAWFWMAVIGLLIPAYYGVYAYASGVRGGTEAMTPVKRAAGWCSAALFVAIGFLFVNGLSLTTNVGAWADLWERHSVAGAATGTALNVGDPTFWPRWLLMFGLALGTTAAWTAIDAAWLAARESEEYRRWALTFAVWAAIGGAAWATAAGTWYVFGTWGCDVHEAMFAGHAAFFTWLTGAIPWLPAVLLVWLARGKRLTRGTAALVGAAQLASLALNAISRQFVQNIELRRLFAPGVSAQPVEPDWGPMAMFLIVFVVGVAVLAWMLAQLRKASPEASH